MKKHLFILFIIFFLTGCASYEKRINLSPQDSLGWSKTHLRHYQSGCGEGKIDVFPIVLDVEGQGYTFFFLPIPIGSKSGSELIKEKGAWIYLAFESGVQIDSCNLSFIALESQYSGKKVKPVNSETTAYAPQSGSYTTGCYYYFIPEEITEKKYHLIISEEVFNCKIEPILYEYEKARQTFMMQMM